MKDIELIHGDCLEEMKNIPDKSVDMVLCDMPYGVLNKNNKSSQWDKPIPLGMVWQQLNRIVKDNGVIVLFAQGMFTAELMMSNKDIWRYNLIWKKGNRSTGFLNSKRMPLRNHEDICVFYKKLPTYNPIMKQGFKNHSKGNIGNRENTNNCYGSMIEVASSDSNMKFPISIIDIPKQHGEWYHNTQKPVSLTSYLINTYTNKGDVVLDFCMGSGGCGVSCVENNRRFIGIELDNDYFAISTNRINKAIIGHASKLPLI